MFYSIHKREQAGITRLASFEKNGDAGTDDFLQIRQEAAVRFIEIALTDDFVFRIAANGRVREDSSGNIEEGNRLGWTVAKPKGMSLSDVTLVAGTASIPGVSHSIDLVCDDFGLNSPHAFKRLF
jgi:hypothetical protein